MGKWLLLAALCLLSGTVQGTVVEHRRGDFGFATGPVPSFVDRADLPEGWPQGVPGADDERWRYWLYDRQSDRRTGHDQVFVDYAYEARGASLVGDAGRYQIDFNPEYQRLTLHAVELRRDGVWQDRLVLERVSLARRESGFEQDLADGLVTALIVLDDVRARDVVRIAYSVSGSNPVLGGMQTDWLRFGWQNPMLYARMRVLLDPGQVPRVHRENGAPDAVVRRRSDAVEVSMEARTQPAIVDEGHYPAWYQPYPLAQVGPDRSWQDVVAWGLPLYPKVATLPDDLEGRVVEWRTLPDARARTTAALRMVQDEVRYFGVEMGENTHRPRPPDETWRRRFGDCKDKVYLLVALLGRMDISAVPALVTTARGRAVDAFVPSAAVFDHVIVRVQLDGEVLWLDPTITLQGGLAGDHDLSRYGAALAIAPGTTGLEPIRPPGQSGSGDGIHVVERYAPDAGVRDVALEIETVYSGGSADSRRRSFATERIDDISRRYADYYRKRLGELEVVALPQVRDDREGNRLTVVERYRVAAPFDDEGASIRGLDTYADGLHSITDLPTALSRTSPLSFLAPGVYRHDIEVALPERWTATFGKEAVALSSPAFDYERRTEVVDGQARLAYRLQVSRPELAGSEASAHLAEVRKLQEGLSATLRFRLPANLAAEERQRRLKDLLRDALEEDER